MSKLIINVILLYVISYLKVLNWLNSYGIRHIKRFNNSQIRWFNSKFRSILTLLLLYDILFVFIDVLVSIMSSLVSETNSDCDFKLYDEFILQDGHNRRAVRHCCIFGIIFAFYGGDYSRK